MRCCDETLPGHAWRVLGYLFPTRCGWNREMGEEMEGRAGSIAGEGLFP